MERFNTFDRAEMMLIALYMVYGEIKGLSFSDTNALLSVKNDMTVVEKGLTLDP